MKLILHRVSRLAALEHICSNMNMMFVYQNTFANESIYDVFEDLAPDLDYSVHQCKWLSNDIKCSDHISSTITKNGLCFEFNALNYHDIYTDE